MRIELNEVNEARSKLAASVKATKSDLSRARTNGNQIQSTDSLKGKVKDAINNEIGNYTIPLMNGYETAASKLQTEFQHLINEFMNIVQETDSNAIIDTDALESMSRDLNHERDNVDDEIKDANKAISSVSDIIDLGKLSNSKVDSKVKSATRKIKKISDNMETFNNVKVKGDIDAVMNSVNSTLKVISPTASAAGAYKSISNKKIFESKKYRKMISQGIKDSNKISTAYEEKDNKELDKTFASLDNEQLTWFGKKLQGFGLGVQGFYDEIDEVIKPIKGIKDGVINLDQTLYKFYKKDGKFRKGPAIKGVEFLWNKALTKKWLSSKIKAGKLSSSLYINLKKIGNLKYIKALSECKGVKEISKGLDLAEKVVHPVKSLVKAFEADNLSTIVRKLNFKSIQQMASPKKLEQVKGLLNKKTAGALGYLGKHAKWLNKISGKGGWVAAGLLSGISAGAAYLDKSNKKTYHNFGHAVVHTAVESVKSAGPISGALAGAQAGSLVGGPVGMAAGVAGGAIAGTANWIWGKVDSKGKDKFYENVENTVDKGVDKVKSVVRSFKFGPIHIGG
ncbi:LXG domain-containing protein [Lactobacillus rodentium]|uniref:LXG domain-containing protein n=1 Tax=Lactobacillus rodentium TaxID=947835 RepID=A0A2Z6T6L2_9LACO|nr:T7SS effector LXG polymorphic toxin [Lactobacillus rodentium]MCR1894179.1 LXG domain-containing protein [Lactobacillus rodentium]GBG04476.1 hypothetical protein LrDSM24759_03900 [Lactobacillus rodentium]